MVLSKKTLKLYGYKTNEDYFNYIIDSYIQGQFKQMKDLIKKLNAEQKEDLFIYIQDNITDSYLKDSLLNNLIKIILGS
jgi:hypothetical protein